MIICQYLLKYEELVFITLPGGSRDIVPTILAKVQKSKKNLLCRQKRPVA